MAMPKMLSGDVESSQTKVRPRFSAKSVGRVIRAVDCEGASAASVRLRWLEAVAATVSNRRPDIAPTIISVLGVDPGPSDYLKGLSIGEIGVCYEAILARLNRGNRKSSGQFFTPDDAAHFMAQQSRYFQEGKWIDPCCGVGNLSWHLASVQESPGHFVRSNLLLVDIDETALKTAVALISADWVDEGDSEAIEKLYSRSRVCDFLSAENSLEYDYVIVNPPYARTEKRFGFETSDSRDLFAYFIEKIAKHSRGYISVTPASYLSAPKFQVMRKVISENSKGGKIFVFDNVPDTLFRGYKYGSNNTSKTNFVRAAVTVCTSTLPEWEITPIIRWTAATRSIMFANCSSLLVPRRIGPNGEWAKITPGMQSAWDTLIRSDTKIGDMTVKNPTEWALDVALTPRYYISAARRRLNRGSKATLYFESQEDRDRAAIVLNSSIPYLWWRALDGGVTLPRRVLMSTPVPDFELDETVLDRLWSSEDRSLVIKLNAGRENENIKHSLSLVEYLNSIVIPGRHNIDLLYASSMFPLPEGSEEIVSPL